MVTPHPEVVTLMVWIGLVAWIITIASLLGNWLIGNKHHSGWAISIATGTAAAGYDCVTTQWGFLVGALIGVAISVRNFLNWHPDLPAVSEIIKGDA